MALGCRLRVARRLTRTVFRVIIIAVTRMSQRTNHRRLKHRALWAGLGLVAALAPFFLLFSPGAVISTPDLMTRLPAYGRFRCALCHTSSAPVSGSADLNVFGSDFQKNDKEWNAALAMLNSDGDRCSNGFELGDENGDGVLESKQTIERSNPSDGADCSTTVDRETWGQIKELFRSEMRDYFNQNTIEQ